MNKQTLNMPSAIKTEDQVKSPVVENATAKLTHNQHELRKTTTQTEITTTDSVGTATVTKNIYQSTASPKPHSIIPQQMNNYYVPRDRYDRRNMLDNQMPPSPMSYFSPHTQSLPYAPCVSPNNNGIHENSDTKNRFHPHKPRQNMSMYSHPEHTAKQQMQQKPNNVGIRQNSVNRQVSQSNLSKKGGTSNSVNRRSVSNPVLSDKMLNANYNCDKNNNVEARVTNKMVRQKHPKQSSGIYKLNNGDKTSMSPPPLVDTNSSSSSSTSSRSSVHLPTKRRERRTHNNAFDQKYACLPYACYDFNGGFYGGVFHPELSYVNYQYSSSRKGRSPHHKYPDYILQDVRFQNHSPPTELINPSTDINMSNSPYNKLTDQVMNKFQACQQTEGMLFNKMTSWKNLQNLVKSKFYNLSLHVVGSTLSGFGSYKSDVDMCLTHDGIDGRISWDARTSALQLLEGVKKLLDNREIKIYRESNVINAKVPILRFKDTFHKIDIDMNFNNSVGIHNTYLLKCYTEMDWRLRPLGIVVKLWAQHHNINSAQHMTISSYSLVLMVINFLQCGIQPPVLPCLQKEYPAKFGLKPDSNSTDSNEDLNPFYSENTLSLGELFLNFFDYYSHFNFSSYAISVRKGCVIPIEECRQYPGFKNDPNQWKELCIEEPFDRTNTAHSCYDAQRFECIKLVFKKSYEALRDSKDLSVIFSEPFLSSPPEQ